MSISAEIVDSYKNARPVIARKLAQGPREDQALALVMGASGLFFVASIPGNLRAAAINPDVPLEARLSGALLALLFIAPLIFYVLAGITGLILRLFGGPKGLYGARIALFWALFCAAPLALLQSLISGFLGPVVLASAIGIGGFIVFLYIWIMGLTEVFKQT